MHFSVCLFVYGAASSANTANFTKVVNEEKLGRVIGRCLLKIPSIHTCGETEENNEEICHDWRSSIKILIGNLLNTFC
jgi:hypothetical protein